MSSLGQRLSGTPAHVSIASITTAEGAIRHPHRKATGKKAAPTPTAHSTAYPSGGASNTIMAIVITTFQPGRRAEPHENRVADPKTERYPQELDSSIAVAAPPVCVLGLPLPTKDTLRDNFLACATKNLKMLAAVRTHRLTPSLSSSLVGVCQLRVVTSAASFRFQKYLKQ